MEEYLLLYFRDYILIEDLDAIKNILLLINYIHVKDIFFQIHIHVSFYLEYLKKFYP